jgi:hypothetical protein
MRTTGRALSQRFHDGRLSELFSSSLEGTDHSEEKLIWRKGEMGEK